MEHTKRNITIIIFIIIVAAIGWVIFSKPKTQPSTGSIATTTPDTLVFNGAGLTFSYPAEIKAYQQDDTVVLHHEIPYKNTGACDMSGEETIYDKLTDFQVTMRISNSPLVATVKSISPYIPEENFDGNTLKVNPGFIDTFEAGVYKGFVIYEGAEGCGVITHYFPIANNKTLIVQRASIQALSGVRGQEEVQKILAVPGAISKEASNKIFIKMFESLTVTMP